MEWREIKRDSDGVRQYSLDAMYVQLPIIVIDKMGNVVLVTKQNWLYEKGFLDAHKDYTHYLPVPQINYKP